MARLGIPPGPLVGETLDFLMEIRLDEREELMRLGPALDGHEVMARLGIPPGPLVGEALDFLMEVRLDEGEISKEEALGRLDEWFARRK